LTPLDAERMFPAMTAISETIAATIRAELARRKLTQEGLAAALGLSQPNVSRRLAGATPWNVEELAAVADLFGMEVRDLLPAAKAVTT